MAGYLPWATIRDHWKVTSGILVSPIGETLNEGREVCDRQGTLQYLEYELEWMRH